MVFLIQKSQLSYRLADYIQENLEIFEATLKDTIILKV